MGRPKLVKVRIGTGITERAKMGLKDDLKRKVEEWLTKARLLAEHTAKTYVSCLHKLVCKVITAKQRGPHKILLKDKAELKAFVTVEWANFSKELRLGSDRLQAAW